MGKTIHYQIPLGIYVDGEISGRVHDSIIPKFYEIDPEKLVELDRIYIEMVRRDAVRQLRRFALKDTEEAIKPLQNTVDLTISLLQEEQCSA